MDRAFDVIREMMENLPRGSEHEIDFTEGHKKCIQKGNAIVLFRCFFRNLKKNTFNSTLLAFMLIRF